MDIARISAISPIIKTDRYKSKDDKTDAKSREDKNGKEFEKTLKAKRVEEVRKDAYNWKNKIKKPLG